mgnify:CR=1 FL=1
MFDTERIGHRGWKYGAQVLGLELPDEVIAAGRGMSVADSRAMYLERLGPEVDYDALRALRVAYADEAIARDGLPVKPGLRQLLEQQQALGRELQELCSSILDEMILPAQAAQSLPNYCVRIPEDWDGAGKSLGALKFWRATGATVVAIRRSGQEIVSPGPDTALRCGDLLIFVGDLEARKGVVRFFSSNP